MISDGSPFRLLPLRKRDDLQVVEQTYRGEKFFVVGDPLAMEYYRLNEQEHFLLDALVKNATLDGIKRLFETNFAPHRITHREIQTYLIDFHKKSLIASIGSDLGRHQYVLGQKKKLKKVWENAKNLLALRWRGINPDWIFRQATTVCGWFFSRWMFAINVVFMLTALLWLGTHFQDFQTKLPTLEHFFRSSNWLPLAIVLIGLKIAHEFGHGIAFTRLGGRCHELGVMFLVFVPTLYVNTSQSWKLPNKWHRIAIAGAGIYVELFFAAAATYGWWFSKPGLFQYLCLNVMFLGSVSAFLFNGNPLLKFDGYFMLADLLEIPNLQQRSGDYIRNSFLRWGMGIREGDEHLSYSSTKFWLATYAISAYLFRIFLVYVIAFMVVQIFGGYGLADVGRMFSFAVMCLLLIVPAIALGKYFWIPGRFQRREVTSMRILTLVIALILGFIMFVPVKSRVTCDFVVEPKDARTAYVRHAGTLEIAFVQPHEFVKRGQPIAVFKNIDNELELTKLKGELATLRSEMTLLKLANDRDSTDAGRMRTVRENTRTVLSRINELEVIQSEMTVRAPRDGHVIPRWTVPSETASGFEMKGRDGWTFDSDDKNPMYQRGQALCDVGDLKRPTAKVLIDQSDVKFVRRGQTVRLQTNAMSDQIFDSSLSDISASRAAEVYAGISNQFGGSIEASQTQKDEDEISDDHRMESRNIVYQSIVDLPELSTNIELGTRGKARIDVEKQTLAAQLYWFLNKTFRIDL